MRSGKIVVRNRRVYVAIEFTMIDRPVRVRRHYEIECHPSRVANGDHAMAMHDGWFAIPEPSGGPRVRTCLKSDGVVWVEESALPKPETVCPVRWNGCLGMWEKQTSKGWVEA